MVKVSTGSLQRAAIQTRCWPIRKPPRSKGCVRLENPPERPDPAIYSQQEELSAGREPNWNSPDITTNHWEPWRLFDEPEVRVRNLSGSVSAINTLVLFSVAPFGIGTAVVSTTGTTVNLGPGQEQLLKFPMPQSLREGDPRVATRVQIEHSTDKTLINNHGAQTIDGVMTSDVGRNLSFQFPVRNSSSISRTMNLQVLSNDVGAAVAPGAHSFGPFEQITATLTMTIPAALHPGPDEDLRREITVMALGNGGALIGGVTYIVRIDD